MKNRLYAFLTATMLLFTLLGISNHALSASISSLGDMGSEISPPSGISGDTVIQFPDPNFEAAVREIIGKPNGDIIASDVAEITYLDVDENDIADLTGIEYFTALMELYCSINALTTLDVSHNPLLTKLDCSDNQLTALDVSRNAALERLDCFGNQLTTLDVSHNAALMELDCDENSLTTLDVSHNAALTKLKCGMNRLTMLDVSQNPALELLFCYDNPLTMIDVSLNPALKELSCNNNSLTVLDLSRNPALEGLSIIGNPFSDKLAIIGLDESRLEYFCYDQLDQ